MDQKPNYDYRLSKTDPEAYKKDPSKYTKGIITLCNYCETKNIIKQLESKKNKTYLEIKTLRDLKEELKFIEVSNND